MDNEFEDIDALIAKLLAGEATPGEAARLERWKEESELNRRQFAESQRLLSAMDVSVDTNAAWKRLNQRIITEQGPARVIPLYRRPLVVRAAAAMLLLASLGIIAAWFLHGQEAETAVLVAVQQARQEQLPDGSNVFMNKNSEISYEVADNGTRRVSLKGEAYFEVKHDAEKPFVIHVNDLIIEDIGTAFNVKAIPGSNLVEVIVESGEVKFYTPDDPGLNLTQGESAIYNTIEKRFSKSALPAQENATSYRTRLFRFVETPLKQVVAQLNAVYDTDIRVADEATGNLRLSVVFNNEQPDLIVSIIAETLDLEVDKTGSSVLLRGKTGGGQQP